MVLIIRDNMPEKKRKLTAANKTLALADRDKKDKKTNVTRPSDYAVEETRNWSIENKK